MEQVDTLWHKYFYHLPDPRMKDLPLLGSPVQVTLLTAAWLYFVLRAGPRYMEGRKPYSLKRFVQLVNLSQILINAYFVYEMLDAAWFNGYSLCCQPLDKSNHPDTLRMARAVYAYFWLKIYDLLDTVIFVLRRKNNQVSFLHLFHHFATLSLAWIGANYSPGGTLTLAAVVNMGVHCLMYTYYFLATLGPQMQPYLWWKKYLTQIQMMQFIFLFMAAMNVYIFHPTCDLVWPAVYAFLFIDVSVFALFLNFYIRAYKQPLKNHLHKPDSTNNLMDKNSICVNKLN